MLSRVGQSWQHIQWSSNRLRVCRELVTIYLFLSEIVFTPNLSKLVYRQSTYDTNSIYEPITPRPSSQLSNRSTYSTGSGLSSIYSGYYPSNTRSRSAVAANPLKRTPIGEEAEVDHLTDLLVLSMENSSDPDFFGEFLLTPYIFLSSVPSVVCLTVDGVRSVSVTVVRCYLTVLYHLYPLDVSLVRLTIDSLIGCDTRTD